MGHDGSEPLFLGRANAAAWKVCVHGCGCAQLCISKKRQGLCPSEAQGSLHPITVKEVVPFSSMEQLSIVFMVVPHAAEEEGSMLTCSKLCISPPCIVHVAEKPFSKDL